ncbi:biogenesis of lysosome-related organelles complex 1 subunit 3 [Strigops habroptila]|uniref:biogenesis of lysosome-related organelles complex 1 subunit 3 n=1 Tax=Strigops habroptila TaxID=2489341 RepID=UPI0011CF35E8|nr:biogenesis of lysosome-related organelles complex 1 subunit 3 [Strigops habroptila]
MSQRPPPGVVPGEASESDSDPEPPRGGGTGLKLPGEASESDEEVEARRAPPAGRADPSLLQQRLRAGAQHLGGAVVHALRRGYGRAARGAAGLGAALAQAQSGAAAAAHCLRVARGDLRAVAAAVDIVTACRLLPDVRGAGLPPGGAAARS